MFSDQQGGLIRVPGPGAGWEGNGKGNSRYPVVLQTYAGANLGIRL